MKPLLVESNLFDAANPHGLVPAESSHILLSRAPMVKFAFLGPLSTFYSEVNFNNIKKMFHIYCL